MAIAGGFGASGFQLTWSIVMPGGRECTTHDLPDIPYVMEGYGLAQAYDRYIFFCGGRFGVSTCEYLISKNKVTKQFFQGFILKTKISAMEFFGGNV